jgi:hypothetical protein
MLPKAEKEERRVFGPKELWDDLTETAEFHTDAFKEIGASETVSRNDLIIAFLKWADKAFWDDKGGRPKNPVERKKKLVAFAEDLKKELEAGGEDESNDGQSR